MKIKEKLRKLILLDYLKLERKVKRKKNYLRKRINK